MRAVAAAAATMPPAVAMNRRRSVVMALSSSGDELMVGAFRDVIPRRHQRLELGERRVDFPRNGGLLGFLLQHLAGQLLEVAKHRDRELEDLDLPLELR